MSVATVNPLHRVLDALEAAGCEPAGGVSRCPVPAHDDRRPSLAITEGCDGRVLLFCRAGCATDEVVAALGMQLCDLFVPGHSKARRAFPTVQRNPRPAEALLAALDKVGAEWSGIVSSACPYCDHPAAWWRLTPSGVDVNCPEGCSRQEVLRALETYLELGDKGLRIYPERAA